MGKDEGSKDQSLTAGIGRRSFGNRCGLRGGEGDGNTEKRMDGRNGEKKGKKTWTHTSSTNEKKEEKDVEEYATLCGGCVSNQLNTYF